MEVRKSPVPLNETVQGSTRTSYCLVPSCKVSFRGTGHLGTVLILQCTALYSDVSTHGFQRNFSVSKHITCLYMPVYTGVYQHVPAYTNMTLWYLIVPPCRVLYPLTDSIWKFAPLDIFGYPWICKDIKIYQKISKDIFGGPGHLLATYP